jgi:hypothetical protein
MRKPSSSSTGPERRQAGVPRRLLRNLPMKPEQDEPTVLTIAAPKGSSPVYPWIGLLVGAGVGCCWATPWSW